MSVLIETTDELLVVLKKLGIKIANVDELRGLLVSINANYNPDAARTRTAKLVGISVPCTMAAVAGLVSLVLTERGHSDMLNPPLVGALAVVWSACALVSVTSLIFSFVLLARRRSAPAEDRATAGKISVVDERLASAITRDLEV